MTFLYPSLSTYPGATSYPGVYSLETSDQTGGGGLDINRPRPVSVRLRVTAATAYGVAPTPRVSITTDPVVADDELVLALA